MFYQHDYERNNEPNNEMVPTDADDFMLVAEDLNNRPYYWNCIWCGKPAFGIYPEHDHDKCWEKPDA